MSYADGRYWITYNGEIYNYLELREELCKLGHRFVSQSDTEVILAAYAQWGEACQEKFIGMWAFVLVDSHQQLVFASRDRFGIKPLFFWNLPDGTLALASEIKQFTVLPGWNAKADLQGCYDFLTRGLSQHRGGTMFSGVRQLLRGSCFTLRWRQTTRPNPRSWYRLPATRLEPDLKSASEEFERLLAESVRLHLRSDVKVGSCLSGGLDSSSIVAMVNRYLREQGRHELQETVSSCFDIAQFDERPFIQAVAQLTGVRTHYVFPDYRKLFSELPRLVWHQDEPFGSTSIYAQWNVFREASLQGLKVMLDGQGADEMLAGYHGFFSSWFAHLARRLALPRLVRELLSWHRKHGYSPWQGMVLLAHQLLPHRLRRIGLRFVGRATRPDWLNVDYLDRAGVVTDEPEIARPAGSIYGDSIRKLLHSSLPLLLHFEDRDSMAHSVEARVPFVEHRLIEFVVSLPDHMKIQNGETKYVMRRALRGILPEEVRTRQDKMGFVTPEEVWLREAATGSFREAISQACELAPDLFNKTQVVQLFESYASGRRRFDFLPWRLACFGAWMNRFDVRM
jgi:asparagine synthase (glutamine-hydrolysing)